MTSKTLTIPDDIARHLEQVGNFAATAAEWLSKEVTETREFDPEGCVQIDFDEVERLVRNLKMAAAFCSWLASRDDQDRAPENG